MRRVLVVMALLCAGMSPAWAGSFQVHASAWDTEDADDTFGIGVALGLPLGGEFVSLDLRAAYYEELESDPFGNLFDSDPVFEPGGLELLPLEAGLRFNFSPDGSIQPYVGGGMTFFILDTDIPNRDVDDEFGWYLIGGSRFGDDVGPQFVVEAQYRSTEATFVDTADLNEDVAIDLDGLALNAGIAWSW